jgi:hypothetical protein
LKTFGLALLAGCAITAAVTAVALALGHASGKPPLDRFSGAGTPVNGLDIAPGERSTLAEAGIALPVRLLSERAGIRFYVGKSAVGSSCFITGLALSRNPHFGVLTCPSDFPSADLPILDYSPLTAAVTDRYPHVQRLAGFAADGIESVGVRDESGAVRWIDVSNNIYASEDVPARGATAILARAANGEIVYSRSLGGEPQGSQYGSTP